EAGTFGIKVNAIAAGIFDTDLAQALPERWLQMHDFWTSSGRLGRPRELAEYAAFMVSDRNSFMNGEGVIVDGGTVTLSRFTSAEATVEERRGRAARTRHTLMCSSL